MQTIVDGYNIEYRISGNGSKTIVILQGWGTSFDFYNTIADCFDESFRVMIYLVLEKVMSQGNLGMSMHMRISFAC